MRMPSRKFVLGAALLALAGGGVAHAAAEKLHVMNVAAPDGSTIQVAYAGDVAPRVDVVPASASLGDPFAGMDSISAMMDAQMQAMMRQAAMMDRQAAQMQQQAVTAASAQSSQQAPGVTPGLTPGLTMVGTMPKGMHMTYTSTTTDAHGCTRTVSYASDGSGAAPKMTQAASDGCDALAPNSTPIPAKAETPAQPQVPANQRT